MKNKKIAVVLLNLGGPDQLNAVKPFLFNLFSDPAIIRLPQPFRWAVAWLISTLRYKKAQGIYEKLGGKSPLLDNTEIQSRALSEALKNIFPDVRIHICMRYWNPMADQVIRDFKNENPDHIVLLPLYPQFSTTTTASSVVQMEKMIKASGLTAKLHKICCYPTDDGFIRAHVNLLQKELYVFPKDLTPRVVFSAHGVPQDVIDNGDPYEWQVNQTVSAIMKQFSNVDYRLCYQSKVGPKKWLGPAIDATLREAAQDHVGVLVVPIAFVSDHSETLVELDMDYRDLASELKIPYYVRVPALADHPLYIESLKSLVTGILEKQTVRICPKKFCACINQ